MELKANIAIVSCFGRGNWLATELARKGISVALLDVTDSMGNWAPEDWEGPFGYFQNEKVQVSQIERLISDESVETLQNGFCIWLKSGPLELKGPLTQYRLDKLKINPSVIEYIQNYSSLSVTKQNLEKEKVQKLSFDESWLAHLAHQWSSTTYAVNADCLQKNSPSPIFDSFYVRNSSRQSIKKSMDWVRSHSVDVFEKAEIMDLSFGGKKNVTGIEIKSDRSGLLKFDQLVWMLSSEETKFINEKVATAFYPRGVAESEWSWVRYRGKMKACLERDLLPLQILVLGEVDLPWSHENYCIVRRTLSQEDFDLWIRVPTVQRFNKQYLIDRAAKLKQQFDQRIPEVQIVVTDYPQEYHYTYQQLGPCRNPVYSKFSKLVRNQMNNLFYDGPEDWDHLGWNGVHQAHTKISLSIFSWWNQLQAKLAKERQQKEIQ
jgi:hypothetical protein